MKRTISQWIGIAIMAGAITFTLIQVRLPVVRAEGCPDQPFPECLCNLNYSVEAQMGGGASSITCYYDCNCGGPGGGGDFLIEREYTYWQ